MFRRLGTWCHDHRRVVLGLWIAVLVIGGTTAGATGSAFRDEFNPPDVESKWGFDILDEEFGGQGTDITGTVVFRAEQGVDDPEVRRAVEALLAEVATIDDVTGVESPYGDQPGAESLVAGRGPDAGRIAYANITLPEDIDFTRAGEIRDLIREAEPTIDGLEIELGGFIFSEFEEPSSEILGVAFAVVILIVAFGSVLAMGLPVGVALFGIGLGSVFITLLSHVMTIPDFASFLGIMIGLGVGIDYALLIVTRYREQLHLGHPVREAITVAIDTAGRSVLFAGTTVVISLLGMLLMGVTFVQGLAVGASLVVALTVAASLTLLPALIGFAGGRVEITKWRGLIAAALVAVGLVGVGLEVPVLTVGFPAALLVLLAGFLLRPLQRQVLHRTPRPRQETLAYRWSRSVAHHPWRYATLGTLLLLVLAVPVSSLRLGFSDEGNLGEETSTRQAYDLLADGFGPGFNGPMILVAELGGPADQAGLAAVTDAVAADPGVEMVSEPRGNGPDPARSLEGASAVVWNLVPTTSPQDEATVELVGRLRNSVLPAVEGQAGVEVLVTGGVPVNVDFAQYLSSRMPYFFAAVLAVSFLLLMVVFRSILVPLKAVIMNLLSISAAYGIVVALFQWGWLSDITGVQPAPIEPWAPMMLFAIVFGLSMDYEVFLLSRVREEWHRTGDSRTSVADGLAATAKVITAAAAIMVFVFGSFILENDRVVKLMGVGLASAIFMDATIVRMVLVPATMELLGDRNWWLPRWLDRLLPTLDVEGVADHTPDETIDLREPAVVDGRHGPNGVDGVDGAGGVPGGPAEPVEAR